MIEAEVQVDGIKQVHGEDYLLDETGQIHLFRQPTRSLVLHVIFQARKVQTVSVIWP